MNKKELLNMRDIASFAIIISGGVIVSFVPDANLKIFGALLINIGVAIGSLVK